MAALTVSDHVIRITTTSDGNNGVSTVSDDEAETKSLNELGLEEHKRPLPPHVSNSLPVYQSPLRQHRRTPPKQNVVKETPNAHSYNTSTDDGQPQRRINQYIIGEEIGRGSFGAVHMAADQWGNEFAVKEFSKSRLRHRARSNYLRRPPGGPNGRRPGRLFPSPFPTPVLTPIASPLSTGVRAGESEDTGSSLHLIQGEIAVMKKLQHENLVQLIEVLDDPDEDSLYMVLELCKKGVVMKVSLTERATPYPEEVCRCWFRDLVLGIEYLHAQGIAHRDIKPDNLLITTSDCLKIVDFGVSEIFEKGQDMMTAKAAGSPAFLPPELCVPKHGDVNGKAADIWSMGVSLYCLRFGRLPFEEEGVLELFEAIRRREVDCEEVDDPDFVDLMRWILEKDPTKRITMDQLREHPWVTKSGSDPLLEKQDNIASLVEPPTQAEMNHAITHNIGKLVFIMKAVNQFKRLLLRKHPERAKAEHLFGDEERRFVAPPEQMDQSKDGKLEGIVGEEGAGEESREENRDEEQ